MPSKPAEARFLAGFTIIEVIAAVFILTVGVVGVFSAVNYALSATQNISSRLIAAYLAQEGIEVVRNIRDGNWLEQRTNPTLPWDAGIPTTACGVDYTQNSCLTTLADAYLRINSSGLYGYQSGTATSFKRKIETTKAPGTMNVKVTVTWQERGRIHSFVAQEILTNWRNP